MSTGILARMSGISPTTLFIMSGPSALPTSSEQAANLMLFSAPKAACRLAELSTLLGTQH